MVQRVKFVASANGRQVKIRGKDEFGQYVVEFYSWNDATAAFTHQTKGDYFTDNWADAIGTANHFLGLPFSQKLF